MAKTVADSTLSINVKMPDTDAAFAVQSHELGADLPDRRGIVLPEIGYALVIGDQPTDEPHPLYIAGGLTFQTPAGLHTVQVSDRRRKLRTLEWHNAGNRAQ